MLLMNPQAQAVRYMNEPFLLSPGLITQHLTLGTQHPALGTQHLALGTQHLAPATRPASYCVCAS